MEMGYKSSKKFSPENAFGAWKFCDEDHLRRIVGETRPR